MILSGQGEFIDVMKLRILKWSGCSGRSGWTLNVITRVLIRESQRKSCLQIRKGQGDHRSRGWSNVATRQRVLAALALEDEKDETQIFLYSLQKKRALQTA